MTTTYYRFGAFTLSVATRELAGRDGAIELPASAFDCLAYLVEHRDRAVGRDELIAAVWGRAEVSEALLNHTILKIRRALGGGTAWIRTVPRFGYHWVGAIDVVEAASNDVTRGEAATRGAPRTRAIALAVALAVTAAATVAWFASRNGGVAPSASQDIDERAIAAAMVLPAEVDAGEDWRWLRLGLMDLVARRLRDGKLRAAPSESVVGVLAQREKESGEALLRDPSLATFASLRVLPRARHTATGWTVALDALGTQRELTVEASAADAMAAARDAADRLLAKLGHAARVAGGESVDPALDDLLERSGADMLADRLDAARARIDDAPPAFRERPAVQQRLAQIELRAGDYEAAIGRTSRLLDRLGANGDPALRARALVTLAAAAVRRDDFDKADEAYAEAIALRSDADDPEVLGVAHLGRGAVLAQRARFDEASAELGRARIELESAGDPLGVAAVDVNLGEFETMRERPAAALPILVAAAHRFRAIGAREGLLYSEIAIAAVQHDLVDPDAALATTDRFWPAALHTSNARLRWRATLARAGALLDGGKSDAAAALVDSIRSGADRDRDAAAIAGAELVAARLARRRGDRAGAARLAARAPVPALAAADPLAYARALRLRAETALSLGDEAAVDSALAALNGFTTGTGAARAHLYALLVEGARDWAADRRDDALRRFEAASAAAARLDVPVERIEAALPLIEAQIEVGHMDEAGAAAGRIAPWVERDPRVARAELRLYRALGREDAAARASRTLDRLGGEGAAPDPLPPRLPKRLTRP